MGACPSPRSCMWWTIAVLWELRWSSPRRICDGRRRCRRGPSHCSIVARWGGLFFPRKSRFTPVFLCVLCGDPSLRAGTERRSTTEFTEGRRYYQGCICGPCTSEDWLLAEFAHLKPASNALTKRGTHSPPPSAVPPCNPMPSETRAYSALRHSRDTCLANAYWC